MASSSSGICCGCTIDSLGQDDSLCISSVVSNTKSSGTYETVSVQTNSDCTSVAPAPLVHKSVRIVSCTSNKTSHITRVTRSTKNKDMSPKSGDTQSDGMAALNRQFRNSSFSKETRQLLSASWRRGTQSDYIIKFNKFNSWCYKRQKDPYFASISDCANIFTSLFHSGLQYRTISGYRSMLSAVVKPVKNIPVGQHPDLIRLLRGVFVSRPPTLKLVPEWELSRVLQMLQKAPFEPLSSSALKFLTYKTVFLVALTTFRRCADIQALRLGEGWVNIQNKGITFLRPGLCKQDRPGHFGSKIFVPSFKENKKLDPKRTLYWYLKKIEQFRSNTTEEVTQLFLSFAKPHKPVSKGTIARWIVDTIRMAYDLPISVKAHSTRAIGPSWALFNGATMQSILEAADWSRETTFIKFYLRNVDVSVLKC